MAGYEAAFKYKLIYIMAIHDVDHAGYLKIGDATLASALGPSQLPPNCELLNVFQLRKNFEHFRVTTSS